ncbi:hypothetical protein [Atlantibacter sp.]|uniref:hypothetical protein n=1 Tax=Atlantibacter sp. TaxID=1903473 RepID=UPI0028A88E05|nr:hypothetical protein [Atlantibacter sp.]
MKTILMVFLCLFMTPSYSKENYKTITFHEASISLPAKWSVSKKNDCMFVKDKQVSASDYLKICRDSSSEEGDYFKENDDGEWEAVTDGVPVLADVNVTPKFTGMSAIVSCKYKDDAGYHSEQCFQAEINLPLKITFIFTSSGNPKLFKNYKDVYLSFRVK